MGSKVVRSERLG